MLWILEKLSNELTRTLSIIQGYVQRTNSYFLFLYETDNIMPFCFFSRTIKHTYFSPCNNFFYHRRRIGHYREKVTKKFPIPWNSAWYPIRWALLDIVNRIAWQAKWGCIDQVLWNRGPIQRGSSRPDILEPSDIMAVKLALANTDGAVHLCGIVTYGFAKFAHCINVELRCRSIIFLSMCIAIDSMIHSPYNYGLIFLLS